MELKYIKELMAAMGRTGITRLSLKEDDVELVLERSSQGQMRLDNNVDLIEDSKLGSQSFSKSSGELPIGSTIPTEAPKAESGIFITSPMVGTFYPAPAPDEAPFIKIGDKVEKNSVVCIVEAMKVMNEIKAGVSGTIAEIYVSQGDPIEFGAKLFRVTGT